VTWPPTVGELRELLRDHALVITPGETLILTVPPDWQPIHVRELQDALTCYCTDPEQGFGFRILVVPGLAVTVAQMPADPFGDA
jgi:hypothetical protein